METPTKIDVVRIPCKPSRNDPISLINIPLIYTGPGGIDEDSCNSIEKRLGHFPDLRSSSDPKIAFNWGHRHLSHLSNKGGLSYKTADYMIYVCLDQRAALPHNEFLEGILNNYPTARSRPTSTDCTVVYGDAFVFRMEPTAKIKAELELELTMEMKPDSERKYINMDQDFIISLRNRSYCVTGLLDDLLRYQT